MRLRTAIRWLAGLTLGLPLLQAVLLWTAGLLRAMADEAAANVLGRINVAAGVLWLVSLVGLVVCLGLKASFDPVIQDELPDDSV